VDDPRGENDVRGDRSDGGETDPEVETVADADADTSSDADAPNGGDVPDADDPDLEPEPALTISSISTVENTTNVLALYAEWTTNLAVETRLEVVCGEDYDQTFNGSESRLEHRVFVAGLYEGADCDLAAVARTARQEVTVTTSYEVGPLPEDLVAFDAPTVRDEEAIQPGWTFLNVSNNFDGPENYAVMIDSLGDIAGITAGPECAARPMFEPSPTVF
jgi:hypothetical protein